MRRWVLALFLALGPLVAASAPAKAERRLALVIGIDEYKNLPRLVRPVGDARAVAAALTGLGFQATTVVEADRAQFEEAVNRFLADLEPDDIALVHFSGHGTRLAGDYLLLPSDAPAPGAAPEALRNAGGVGVVAIADQIKAAGARGEVIIVDACRGDPYAEGGAFASGSACGGLPRQPPEGTLVLFSASTGQRALDRLGDNDSDPHTVFARTLVRALGDVRGGSVVDLARQVRDEVARLAASVNYEQRPAYLDEMGSAPLVLAARRQPDVIPATPEARLPSPAPPPVAEQRIPLPPRPPLPPSAAEQRAPQSPAPQSPAPQEPVRGPSARAACAAVAPGPPAFDCRSARATVEMAICQDPGLGSCDRVLNRAYQQAEASLGGAPGLRREEDAWVARRNACAGSLARGPEALNACIARAYGQRISELERVASARSGRTPSQSPQRRAAEVRPSFNCRYARSPVELAICADPDLAGRDRDMAELYDRALSFGPGRAGAIEGSQNAWRAARDRCARAADLDDCVATAYDARIRELRGLAPGR